jgi:hypothetical protein
VLGGVFPPRSIHQNRSPEHMLELVKFQDEIQFAPQGFIGKEREGLITIHRVVL